MIILLTPVHRFCLNISIALYIWFVGLVSPLKSYRPFIKITSSLSYWVKVLLDSNFVPQYLIVFPL